MHCFVKFAVLVFLFGCSSSKKEVVKRLPPLCPSKAMQGYEGPCEVYGTMGAANRYFYTSTRRHFLDRTYKKWDLETGQVVADNLSHRETLGIPKELQRYTYPQEGELIVLAEARDIPIAVIAGEFAGEKSELMVVDLSKKKIIWNGGFKKKIADAYERIHISPDGKKIARGQRIIVLAGNKHLIASSTHQRVAPNIERVFGFDRQQRYASYMSLSNLNVREKRLVSKLNGKPMNHQDFYPVDGKRAWVLQPHYSRHGLRNWTRKDGSKTAGLYLVDMTTGNVERGLTFDAGESESIRQLRQYIARKMKFSKKLFVEQVNRLTTPEIYLFWTGGSGNRAVKALDGEKYFMISTTDRTLIYDIESGKAISAFQDQNYRFYPNNRYNAQKGFVMNQGLGKRPVKHALWAHRMAWLPESQTLISNGYDGAYEYTPTGRYTGKNLKGKNVIGSLGGRKVITFEIAKSGNEVIHRDIAVTHFDTGEEIESLKSGHFKGQLFLTPNKKQVVLWPVEHDGKATVFDVENGREITRFPKKGHKLAFNGVIDLQANTYTDFSKNQPMSLTWKSKKYLYKKYQGQYILTYTALTGLEVFDIATNKYITPIPINTGLHDLGGYNEFRANEMVYFPKRNSLAVINAVGGLMFGAHNEKGQLLKNQTLGNKRAAGYIFDMDTYSLAPVNVRALMWQDPLVARNNRLRAEEKARKDAEERQRRQAEARRREQIKEQEKALLAYTQKLIQQTQPHKRIELFYEDGPLGPYVTLQRKAQALKDHMDVFIGYRNTSTYGLMHVPFGFIEDVIPYLSSKYANIARSKIHRVRSSQLARAKWQQETAAKARFFENFKNALRSYRPPKRTGYDKLTRTQKYQREQYLYGKANRDACTPSNPCGPKNQFRARPR